jgi:hypothetical protein
VTFPSDLLDPPIKSLGWALLDWFEAYLTVPDGSKVGQPFVLEGWQAEFVLRFYAVDDRGQWLHRRGAMQLAKGSGKSPFAAAVALAEFCGPTVFAGWDANGMPVGRRHETPWVQIAAVSLDQTDNTFAALYRIAVESSLVDECSLDVGRTRIYLPGAKGRIEPVTAEAGSREGQRLSFAVLDETHYWTPSNGGRRLAETLRRNLAKTGGRSVETTNAYEPGVRTVAEGTHRAFDSGRQGIQFMWTRSSSKVDDPKDRAQLRPALAEVYAGCPWVDVDRIVEECLDPDTPSVQVRRFYLNEVVATESRMVTDRVLDDRRSDLPLEEAAPVAVGFDGSVRDDATAIVVVDLRSGVAYQWGLWERPAGLTRQQWEVPRDQVSDHMERLFGRFRVVAMDADPSWWREEVAAWQARYGTDVVHPFKVASAVAVDEALEAAQGAFDSGSLMVDGSEASEGLRRHLRAASLTLSGSGKRGLVKPEDGRRIDAAAALVYAHAARVRAIRDGWADVPAEPVVVWG